MMEKKRDKYLYIKKKLKLTKSELARLFGVDNRTIYRWNLGINAPTGTAKQIVDGIYTFFILDGYDKKKIKHMIKEIRNTIQFGGIGNLSHLIYGLLSVVETQYNKILEKETDGKRKMCRKRK